MAIFRYSEPSRIRYTNSTHSPGAQASESGNCAARHTFKSFSVDRNDQGHAGGTVKNSLPLFDLHFDFFPRSLRRYQNLVTGLHDKLFGPRLEDDFGQPPGLVAQAYLQRFLFHHPPKFQYFAHHCSAICSGPVLAKGRQPACCAAQSCPQRACRRTTECSYDDRTMIQLSAPLPTSCSSHEPQITPGCGNYLYGLIPTIVNNFAITQHQK